MAQKKDKAKNLAKFKDFVDDNKFAIVFSVLVVAFLGGIIWLSSLEKIDLSKVDKYCRTCLLKE